jgi:hypothetical protein
MTSSPTSKGTIGFTTTIPVEFIFAAGYEPRDLNNIFVTDPDRAASSSARNTMVSEEHVQLDQGYLRVIMEQEPAGVITVMEGDCSNTQALAEILRYRGIRTIPFSFPYDRDRKCSRER